MNDRHSTTNSLPALLTDEATGYVRASKAANTVKAYRSDWDAFSSWCDQHGVSALPAAPQTLAVYLAEGARVYRPSTLARRCSSIAVAHEMAGHDSPTRHVLVRGVMSGIRRTLGTASEQKAPILTADLRRMVAALPDTIAGVRDRALLLLGFAGAFRRSELVALDTDNLDDRSDGLVVTISRSKTDQEGEGRIVGIPYGSDPQTCPVRAVRAWLEHSGIDRGPVFRPVRHHRVLATRLTDRSVALIVKRVCKTAGFDPMAYAGHSLRAGLATSAAAAGVSERSIMAQTGHRSLPTVRKYIRSGGVFRDNAAAAVGL